MVGIVAHALPSLAFLVEGGRLLCLVLAFSFFLSYSSRYLAGFFSSSPWSSSGIHSLSLGLAVHKSILYAYIVDTKAIQFCSEAITHHLCPSQRSLPVRTRWRSGRVAKGHGCQRGEQKTASASAAPAKLLNGVGWRGNPDARLGRPDRWPLRRAPCSRRDLVF